MSSSSRWRHRHRDLLLPEEPRAPPIGSPSGSPACASLLLNKYYVDEIYDAADRAADPDRLAKRGCGRSSTCGVIDGAVNGVGETVARRRASVLRRLQTGSVRAYAASLFLGVVMILGYYLWQ